jgi:sec-independent protein translocase protein TatC
MLFSFGLIFELPLAVSILTSSGLASPAILIRYRRVAIVLIFIAAAVLTPPDVFTQAILAFPLIVLYEVSIFASKIIHGARKKGE